MHNQAKYIGFTFVEILIALGIVGILGALVVPSLLHDIDEQKLKAQAKGGYSTLLQALDLLSNDWEGELPADRLGVNPRANIDTAGVFANLNYRIKSVDKSATAAGGLHPVAYTNILVLPNNVMFRNITAGNPSTLDMDINGVVGPNVVGTDIFPIQFNFSPNTVTIAGVPSKTLSAFDASISNTLTANQIARWHVLTDTKDANGA